MTITCYFNSSVIIRGGWGEGRSFDENLLIVWSKTHFRVLRFLFFPTTVEIYIVGIYILFLKFPDEFTLFPRWKGVRIPRRKTVAP